MNKNGGRTSVVRELEFKSVDPGFDPLAGQGGVQFFWPASESTLVQTCFVPDPPFVCTARIKTCAHVKDPILICRKRVGLKAVGIETRKHCTQEKQKKKKKLQYYGCSLSQGKTARI